MPRTAEKAVVLLLFFFLANQAQGWSFHNGLSDVAEDNHDEQYDQYFDSEEEDNEAHEEEEDHDYDDLFYLEEDAGKDQRSRNMPQRALRHRSRPRNSEELHGSRSLRSKGRAGSRSLSRSFLDPDIEPRPFINCIPLPPDIRRSGSSKGKGGKGKGNRRRSRRYRSKSRRKLETGSRNLRDLENSGRNLHRGRSRGRSSHSSLSSRSYGGRMGMGGGGRGRRKKLPYCPLPTFEPTFVPTITPFPTFTPLPTITPFPSFTPLPTEEDENSNPSKSPTSAPSVSSRPSAMPTLSNMPSRSNQPSLSNQPSSLNGPTTRTVSGRLEYGFFAGTTIREPTPAEWAGLYAQTNTFYSDVLRAQYPTSFTSFSLTNPQTFYNGALTMPAYFDWDANIIFNTGDAATPTAAQLFLTLSNADYVSYIQNYVWNSVPVGTSIFFNTEMVSFRARGG